MDDFLQYGDAALKSAEKYTSKVLAEIHKGVPDSGLRFLKLTELVPNWETYLTTKQLEAAEKYIKCLNASEVDYQLNLCIGTAQQRLFGNSTSKGAIGKLEEIIKRLENQGYFEKQKAKQQKVETVKRKGPTRVVSDKTKIEVGELIKYICEIPDYEKYLTYSQKERIYQFLRLRSIKQCAKYFSITEVTFKQSLLGKSGDGGILGRLRQAANITMVNNWDDI